MLVTLFSYSQSDGSDSVSWRHYSTENIIDVSYVFTRAAAGQFIEGGRPEVVLVVGDGVAPTMLYEWQDDTWVSRKVIDQLDNGYTIDVLDFKCKI